MRIRVVDYVGNDGGGVRFTVELLHALSRAATALHFELVSHGRALEAYRALFAERRIACTFADVPPRVADGWRFDVPPAALAECDAAWLPWVHRHRLPSGAGEGVVGSFHDAIILTQPSLQRQFARQARDERETTSRWLASPARVVVSSAATVATMTELFAIAPDRLDVVPVSGQHAGDATDQEPPPPTWSWAARPFLLCPANTSPHKNHEALFRGYAAWGARHALALTGSGADLPRPASAVRRVGRALLEAVGAIPQTRSGELRRLARALDLSVGDQLVPVGYVSDAVYYALLRRAWALVMPTLAEGGGSFPIEEAMWCGVPVVCSDIPVIREHVARLGGEVHWFDPHDPEDLACRLRELERAYPEHRRRAEQQIAALRRRTWGDVAAEYRRVIESLNRPPASACPHTNAPAR